MNTKYVLFDSYAVWFEIIIDVFCDTGEFFATLYTFLLFTAAVSACFVWIWTGITELFCCGVSIEKVIAIFFFFYFFLFLSFSKVRQQAFRFAIHSTASVALVGWAHVIAALTSSLPPHFPAAFTHNQW